MSVQKTSQCSGQPFQPAEQFPLFLTALIYSIIQSLGLYVGNHRHSFAPLKTELIEPKPSPAEPLQNSGIRQEAHNSTNPHTRSDGHS